MLLTADSCCVDAVDARCLVGVIDLFLMLLTVDVGVIDLFLMLLTADGCCVDAVDARCLVGVIDLSLMLLTVDVDARCIGVDVDVEGDVVI